MYIYLGISVNLNIATHFEPAKNRLGFRLRIPMDEVIQEDPFENPFIPTSILYLIFFIVSIVWLFVLSTVPKTTLRECDEFERFSGRRLYAACIAILLVSKQNL